MPPSARQRRNRRMARRAHVSTRRAKVRHKSGQREAEGPLIITRIAAVPDVATGTQDPETSRRTRSV